MMRLFLISLGVTCLASVILFFYFKNRIGRMEQKVDLMFQIIQEYEQAKNIQPIQTFQPTTVSRDDVMQMGGNTAHNDLISVSDDDDDDNQETDSEEISDNEEDEEEPTLQIQGQVENIKSISLSGAEIESLVVEPADDLDEISDLEDDDDKKEIITLEETLDEENEDLVESVENNEAEEEEIIDEESVYVKKIEVGDVKPLDKMTVKELRNKAEKDGFTNFKGLRKDKLVELLTSQ